MVKTSPLTPTELTDPTDPTEPLTLTELTDPLDPLLRGTSDGDRLIGSAVDDVVHAGAGRDSVLGGAGNDALHLEDGSDYAEGGLGADTVLAGDGNDVVYGDAAGASLLATGEADATAPTFRALSAEGWTMQTDPETGIATIAQTVATEAGAPYHFAVELAANVDAGKAVGEVDVLWNGAVVETLRVSDGVFQKFILEVEGTGNADRLEIRSHPQEAADTGIVTDAPIAYYETTIEVAGTEVAAAAFLPGQAKLYQVIDGQLTVFDQDKGLYREVGENTGLKLNAVGFNVEDDFLYGISRSTGIDAMGNKVADADLVRIDAEGMAYRVGPVAERDYIGDFDDQGNLWTFHASLNRITKIDVDARDADGNPVVTHYALPDDFFQGRMHDVAFSAEEQAFFAVQRQKVNGEPGQIYRIDISGIEEGGLPEMATYSIDQTVIDGVARDGFVEGTYGAMFLDGEGNIYAGLNRGDHDLDARTETTGAIYRIDIAPGAGTATAELVSTTEGSGSNDGAVDARAGDAFAEVDLEADVLIRTPVLTAPAGEGSADVVRGGSGNDTVYGGAGADFLHGGTGSDVLSGDAGDDKIVADHGDDALFGGAGRDELHGQAGDDRMEGGADDDALLGGKGNDTLSGGTGADYLNASEGNDVADGGAGADRLVGKSGHDALSGGADDDLVWGDSGDDTLLGGDGADYLNAGSGDDSVSGGAGDDYLTTGDGHDRAEGGAGDDRIYVREGDDRASGGEGADVLYGGIGSDTLSGDAGDDFIHGQFDADSLSGGAGADTLVGGTGADTLSGGTGDDHIWTGEYAADGARDVVVKTQGSGADEVYNFEPGTDVVDLAAYGIDYAQVMEATADLGWGTAIDLSGVSGQQNDVLTLRGVAKSDLDEGSFNL